MGSEFLSWANACYLVILNKTTFLAPTDHHSASHGDQETFLQYLILTTAENDIIVQAYCYCFIVCLCGGNLTVNKGKRMEEGPHSLCSQGLCYYLWALAECAQAPWLNSSLSYCIVEVRMFSGENIQLSYYLGMFHIQSPG